jgi:hypothetical protein
VERIGSGLNVWVGSSTVTGGGGAGRWRPRAGTAAGARTAARRGVGHARGRMGAGRARGAWAGARGAARVGARAGRARGARCTGRGGCGAEGDLLKLG